LVERKKGVRRKGGKGSGKEEGGVIKIGFGEKGEGERF